MKNISKIINIALISMLIGVFLCQDFAYAASHHSLLRPPLQFNKLARESMDTQNTNVIEIPKVTDQVREHARYLMEYRWDKMDRNSLLSPGEMFHEMTKDKGSKETVDIFRAIYEINPDWASIILMTSLYQKHKYLIIIFDEDYDKPYLHDALNKGIRFCLEGDKNKDKYGISRYKLKCINNVFDISVAQNETKNFFIRSYVKTIFSMEEKKQRKLLDKLDDQTVGFIIRYLCSFLYDIYKPLGCQDRQFHIETLQKEANGLPYIDILKERPGIINYLDFESLKWFDLSKVDPSLAYKPLDMMNLEYVMFKGGHVIKEPETFLDMVDIILNKKAGVKIKVTINGEDELNLLKEKIGDEKFKDLTLRGVKFPILSQDDQKKILDWYVKHEYIYQDNMFDVKGVNLINIPNTREKDKELRTLLDQALSVFEKGMDQKMTSNATRIDL